MLKALTAATLCETSGLETEVIMLKALIAATLCETSGLETEVTADKKLYIYAKGFDRSYPMRDKWQGH